MADRLINLTHIQQAAKSIKGKVVITPLKKSLHLSKILNKNIYLKIESMQHTGSFKLRGAANVMLNLSESAKKRGVITTSTGNHGRAVAYIANELNIRAVICMTRLVPENKVQAIKELGAEIVIFGDNQNQANEKALEICQRDDMTFISAFDDADVIAGQGTIGLEILEERPEIDTIVVQLSGGGLASGIATAVKAIKPSIRVIAVTLEHGAAMYESMKAGKIVEVEEVESIADALPGPIPADNQLTFDICSRLIDEVVQISEKEILDAMKFALTQEKLVLEGGGAATIAMLLSHRDISLGENVGVICSGDNINVDKLIKLIR